MTKTSKSIQLWLLSCMGLVATMIVLGGLTRLTNSGLSITAWKPVTGIIPPLSEADWLNEFSDYQNTAEFKLENFDMTLSGFKAIFWWEWAHRFLGRLIGIIYFIPLCLLMFLRKIPKKEMTTMVIILGLIGFQGALGWFMVSSGLIDNRTDVSQYRLAAHLGTAFLILGFMYRAFLATIKNISVAKSENIRQKSLNRLGSFLVGLVFLQIIFGALVAGTHAGLTYNTWPLMDGSFFPSGYFQMRSLVSNFGENVTAIQFNHRFLAYVIFILANLYLFRVRRFSHLRKSAVCFLSLVLLQIVLGVITLLTHVALPSAILHQFLAILVFLTAVHIKLVPKVLM